MWDWGGEKFEQMYVFECDEMFFWGLCDVGVEFDDIDFVINIYFYFDYCGCNIGLIGELIFFNVCYVV